MNSTTSVPVADIVAALKVRYPAAVCALDWGGQHDSDPETRRRNGWRLLVMARLSAQCTDARVNQVCRELFRLYPTPEALAAAPQADVEAVIRPCGLFRTKAESIRATCAILAADWAGLVPEDMDTLLSLPGVGRKIANLVRGDLYGQPGIVADTHCIRICGRLGFYPEELKDPVRQNASFPRSSHRRSSRISATASCSSDGIPAPPAPRRAGRVPCGHSVRTGKSFPDGYKKPPNKSAVL